MDHVIISDLHIGADTRLDIFRAQAQLSNFLRSLGGGPVNLIVNGDFLDFLAVEPFGVFTREAAQRKVERIIAAPPNRVLWEGFRAFLAADTRNRVEVLLGNHDLEMVFREVHEALRGVMAAAGEGERVRFLTDHVTHLDFEVGGVPVHLEHGFQYDPFNWYNHNRLLGATVHGGSGEALELPFGSQLVYDVLNRLTPDHPFVPLIKPEPAVLLLMLALAPREVTSRLGMLPGALMDNVKIHLQMWKTGQQFPVGDNVDREGGSDAIAPQVEQMLRGDDLDEETADGVLEFLETGGAGASSFGVVGDLRTKGQLYLLRRGLESLQDNRASFFDANQQDSFQKSLEGILDRNAKVAILGHSHAMKFLTLKSARDARRQLLYLNTGTWADLLDFDLARLATDDALLAWLEQVDRGDFEPTQVFTCGRLSPFPGGVRVSVERWQDDRLTVVGRQEVAP